MDSVEKSLGELASLTGGRVVGDSTVVIKGVASIEDAVPGDVTFIADKRYIKLLESCRASALIATDELENAPRGLNLVLVKNPQLAFAKVLEVLRPAYTPAPGVHAAAVIHPKAVLGKGVSVQACAVVDEGAKIGDNTVLYPGVYIGRNAQIGPDSIIHSGVAIREGCRVGKRVIIHCNSVIGSDGFGYARAGSAHYKIPQTGTVRIEDDVEIGACVTVDRATLGETVIGRGTKIDNLVQIAHNVKVGEDSIIVAQVGIAGSSTVGSRVQLGGQTGVVGHIEIGSDVLVGAKSGVTADLAKGAYSGIPAIPHTEWLRAQNIYKKLPEIWKRLLELEKRLKELEGSE